MDPCPFVRLIVESLTLKLPPVTKPAGPGIHPSTAPCYCTLQLQEFPSSSQNAPIPLASSDHPSPADSPPVVFSIDQTGLGRLAGRPATLAVAVYAGRTGSTCGFRSGRLLGRVRVEVGLEAAAAAAVVRSGWVGVGRGARLHIVVRTEPDPRFVFEFGGEPECSPVVYQLQGSDGSGCLRQPVFSCRFSTDRRRSFRSSGRTSSRAAAAASAPTAVPGTILRRNGRGVDVIPVAMEASANSNTHVSQSVSAASSVPDQHDPQRAMADMLRQQQEFFQNLMQGGGGAGPITEEERNRRALRDFRSLSPAVFSGELDPMLAISWLQDMVKKLETCGIVPERWVPLASFQLQGKATAWWDTIRLSRGAGEPPLLWDEFQQLFKEQYFPLSALRKLESDFLSLQQTQQMSVADYTNRFMELVQYAPLIAASEVDKTNRFVQGLKPGLRGKVIGFMLTRFRDAVDRALVFEQNYELTKKQLDGANQGGSRDRGGRPPKKRFGSDSRQSGQSSQSGNKSKGKGGSFSSKCFYCHEAGHIQRYCPKRGNSQQSRSKSSSSVQNSAPMLPAPSYQPQPLQSRPPPPQWPIDARSTNQGKTFALQIQDPSASRAVVEGSVGGPVPEQQQQHQHLQPYQGPY